MKGKMAAKEKNLETQKRGTEYKNIAAVSSIRAAEASVGHFLASFRLSA
jgi:hypothetical protein